VENENSKAPFVGVPIPKSGTSVKRLKKGLLLLSGLLIIFIIGTTVIYIKNSQEINKLATNLLSGTVAPSQTKYALPKSAAPDNTQKCAEFTDAGETLTVCATCGNGICEEREICDLVVGRGYSESDCGPLFCASDCKGLLPG